MQNGRQHLTQCRSERSAMQIKSLLSFRSLVIIILETNGISLSAAWIRYKLYVRLTYQEIRFCALWGEKSSTYVRNLLKYQPCFGRTQSINNARSWTLNFDISVQFRSSYHISLKYILRFLFSISIKWLACWPLVPMITGSPPAEAVGFFGRKNPQHAFLRKGSKAVCPMSQICGM
jgi:hypothetical protein